MKTKFYTFLIFALFAFAVSMKAQCTVHLTSLNVNQLTVSGTSYGTGDSGAPFYEWTWGDGSHDYTQNASHTYAVAGTYTVCIVYLDIFVSSCYDSICQVVVATGSSGIANNDPVKADVKMMPNPFAVSTSIALTLSQSSDVVISVYDVTGQEVAVLQNGRLDGGLHLIPWKPEGLADGIYFMQIKAGDTVQTRKIIYATGN